MAQPGSFADTLKSRADIVEIVGGYVELKRSGQNFIGRCPFHDERSPSFAVHPIRQIFHCFGCGVGGDVFSFVQKIEGIEFPEALRFVATKYGIEVPERTDDGPEARQRKALYTLFAEASSFFTEKLDTPPGIVAREYLRKRGIDYEVTKEFGFGFIPGDLSELRKKYPDCFDRSGLAGLCGRVALPIHDESGRVIGFKGRAFGDGKPKYLNTPDSPIAAKSRILFNLHRAKRTIREIGGAVLVEGELDAIAAWRAGAKNVVASSTASLTPQQVALLARTTQNVIISYDPDEAGRRGTDRVIQILLSAGFFGRVALLPEGEDPDSLVLRKGVEAYREVLQGSVEFFEYLLSRIRVAKTKAAAVSYLVPFIRSVADPIARSEWADKIAARLGVDSVLVRRAIQQGSMQTPEVIQEGALPKLLPAEERLLQILVSSEELREPILSDLRKNGTWKGLASERIFSRFLEQETVHIGNLSDSLEEPDRRLFYSLFFTSQDAGTIEEAQRCLTALSARRLKEQVRETQQQIAAQLPAIDVRDLLARKQSLQKELSTLTQIA
jgi:DNA primase